jgi:hypothetical protein
MVDGTKQPNRPPLRRVPFRSVWPPKPGHCYATMSVGQWNCLLQVMYDAGFVVIELDDAQRPIAAYCVASVPPTEPSKK